MDLRRRAQSAPQWILKNQDGFAYVFFLSFLPVLLAGFLVILFSQFFLKNWMESLHICRTELLSTQRKTSRYLEQLMQLNPLAQSLRIALQTARLQHAAAIASENYPLAAKLEFEIARIEQQRRQLDRTQKNLISMSNIEMQNGVKRVVHKLHTQSQELQARLPDFFSYQIRSIAPITRKLAVQPDLPDTAPVYELQSPFKDTQALHVSWISEFQTRSPEKYKWIIQKHKKQDGCSASLDGTKFHFQELLIEDRSFSKL